ncbi:MAG: hypothetical protein CMJ83_08665 [Planctomycetes bacterium]|nr:hypothetical protein [Planctomycetota bacterium]
MALSGGGHRASLFGLGVLLYLADAEKNGSVNSISSVSGGSLTNAYIGQVLDYRGASAAEFREKAGRPLASMIANQGTFFAPVRTKIYVVVLVVSLLAILIAPWFLPIECCWSALVVMAGVPLWIWLIYGLRGRVCARAFRDMLFSQDGQPTLMSQLESAVDHVIYSTDLRTSEPVFFCRSFVYGYRFGPGTPSDLQVADAVQASACFPGGFPPVKMPAKRFGFQGPPKGSGLKAPASRLVLVDGGVYDNMGDEWARGYAARLRQWDALSPDREPDTLILVDSSVNPAWNPFPAVTIPVISEVASMLRDMDVLYTNTTTTRRQALIERFDRAQRSGSGLHGALVQISQSPFHVASRFQDADKEWPERAARARATIARLDPQTEAEWARIAHENATLPTTLNALGQETSARLLRHGYVLAMCDLHVILDYPLLDIPGPKAFDELVAP